MEENVDKEDIKTNEIKENEEKNKIEENIKEEKIEGEKINENKEEKRNEEKIEDEKIEGEKINENKEEKRNEENVEEKKEKTIEDNNNSIKVEKIIEEKEKLNVKEGTEEINDAKNEEVKKEEIKNEEIKNEEIKNEEVKNEEVKNKEVKKEEVKNEEVKKEEVKKEEIKNEEIKNEEIKKEEVIIEEKANNKNDENKDINKEEEIKQNEQNFEKINDTNEFSQLKVTMTIVESDNSHKKYVLPDDFIKDKNRCNSLTQKLVDKTKKNANIKLDEFFTKKRHYLIMTDGGKPVYSRFGDEVENNSIFATISAMITKFTIFNNTDDFKEEINIISNNKNKIVFMKKGQLIFIALSKKVDDSVSLLHSQLEYIYNQLMSILTVRFYEKLEDNPSKCLTAMGGTENLFEQIIQYSSNSFISLFNSYQIMNFINLGESRDKINRILEDNKGNSLYCILMTPYEIISFAHSNQITVTSSDLILIQNLIFCTEMLRTQESYVPICLPGISDQGFLQLYSNFSEENIGIIFVTENMDPMCFMEFQKRYNDIYNKIKSLYIEKIVECMRKNNSIKGKLSLFKNNKENQKEINDEELINKLLSKIKQEKGIILDGFTDNPKGNFNSSKNINKINTTKTFTGTFNTQHNIEKPTTSISSTFDKIRYAVVLNKKYNQYIMFNFGMDYRNYSKNEKELIHKYCKIYDIYNNYKERDKEDFFYYEKSDKYYNAIQVNESFLIICSFNFFIDVEEIHKKLKEIFKYFKKHENRYFIVYK